MQTLTKPVPSTDADAGGSDKQAVKTLSLTFQGVFLLQFESNYIRAIVPAVHHHVFSISGHLPSKGTDSVLEGVQPNPPATPEALGWDPALLLQFPASGDARSSIAPFAQITLPYPKQITAEDILDIVLETPEGKKPRKATASCRFEYEVASPEELRLSPVPQEAFAPKNGKRNLLVRTELPEDVPDPHDEHTKAAFAATMKFFPGIHGLTLVSAQMDGMRTLGSGANCKAPIVVSVR